MPKRSLTSGWGRCPAERSSGCCWPWRWSRCPTSSFWTSPCPAWTWTGNGQLLGLLDEIRTRYDLSVLISTHDFNTLHKMDKVILLKQRVLQMGTPEEVLASQEFQTLFYHPTQKGGETQ